jgi:hypothetical protein
MGRAVTRGCPNRADVTARAKGALARPPDDNRTNGIVLCPSVEPVPDGDAHFAREGVERAWPIESDKASNSAPFEKDMRLIHGGRD